MVALKMDSAIPVCPLCHQWDQVQRASAIVSQQTSTGRVGGGGFGLGFGADGLVPVVTVGGGKRVSQTALAARLAPPRQPVLPVWWAWGRWLAIMWVLQMIVLALQDASFLLLAIPGGYVIYRFWTPATPARLRQWRQAMEEWQKVYFCHRCDHSFKAGLSSDELAEKEAKNR